MTTLTLPTSDVGFALCVEKKPVHLKDLGLAGFVDHRVSWVLPNKMLLLTAGETCADPGNPHVFVEQRSDGAFQYVVVYPSDGEDPWRVKRPALTTADLPCAVSSGDECLRNNCTEKLGQCFAVFVATENAEVVVGNKEVWHPLEHDLEEHEKRNFRVPFADEKWAEEEGRKLVPLFDGVEGKDYIDGTKPGAVRTHFFEKDDSSSGGGGKVVVFGYPSCPCLVPVKEKSLVLELLASIWQVPGTRALHVATLSSTDSYFYVVATSAVTSPVTSPTNAAKVTYRVDVFQVDEDSGFDSDNSDDSDADEADGSPRPGGRSTPLYSPSSPLPSPVVKTPPRNALYHSDVSDDDDDDYEAQDATRVGKKSKVCGLACALLEVEAYGRSLVKRALVGVVKHRLLRRPRQRNRPKLTQGQRHGSLSLLATRRCWSLQSPSLTLGLATAEEWQTLSGSPKLGLTRKPPLFMSTSRST